MSDWDKHPLEVARQLEAKVLAGFKEGQRLPIYYNPSNARESVLHNGASFGDYAILTIPVGIFR